MKSTTAGSWCASGNGAFLKKVLGPLEGLPIPNCAALFQSGPRRARQARGCPILNTYY
jgi:hypothetical protein